MAYATLALIQPMDPATGNRVSVYVSSVNDAVNGRLVNGLNSQLWEPAITRSPTLSMTVWNGDFQAAVSLGNAAIALNIETLKQTWPSINSYYWETAPVTIYAEQPGTAWPWTSRFVGKVTGYSRKSQNLTLTAEVDTKPLEALVLTSTYAGTGGIEGDANLKGKVKPLILGWAKNVEPLLIDTINSVYQFCSYGAIEGITNLYERGSDFGAAQADYANYTALVAATIPPGKWGTCLASGLIRLGAPAYGVITGDVKGYKVSTATPRLTGAIINAAATVAGVSSSFIHTASLSAMDTAAAYNCNVVITDQITLLDLARTMALPLNWQAGVNLAGQLFSSQITLTGSAVMTLDAQGKAFPQVVASDELDVSPPYWKTIMGANQSWRVHTADEIAFNARLVDMGGYNSTTTYREGNIVSLSNGSTWVYINGTPSAGNSPDIWPLSSNTFWSNLTPPTGAGKVWTTTTVPSAAESNVGDCWIAPDGTIYDRVNGGGILLDGFAVTLAGTRPQLVWTKAAVQPVTAAATTADWDSVTGTGKPEDGADVTSAITGDATINVSANSIGNIITALPKKTSYRLVRNGVDVTDLASWALTVVNGTINASISSTGVVSVGTVDGVMTNSLLRIAGAYGDAVRVYDISVVVTRTASVISSGGSSTGSIGGSTASTTFTAVGDELTVTVGASGSVSLNSDYTYDAPLETIAQEYARWYRWNGSAYVAIGSEVAAGTKAQFLNFGGYGSYWIPGSGSCDMTDTGLTVSSVQKYKLYARNDTGTSSRSLVGTCSAASS